jgi:hypothetical protein
MQICQHPNKLIKNTPKEANIRTIKPAASSYYVGNLIRSNVGVHSK